MMEAPQLVKKVKKKKRISTGSKVKPINVDTKSPSTITRSGSTAKGPDGTRRKHSIEVHREYIANLLSGLIIFLGGLNILSIIIPYFTDKLDLPAIRFLPPEFEAAGGFIHGVIGIFLVFLGYYLYRRRHGAWTVILFFLTFSLIASIITGSPASLATGVFTLYLIGMLWAYRDMFATPSIFKLSPKRMATFIYAIGMVIYGVLGSITLGEEFKAPIRTWTDAIYFTITTITTVGFGDYTPITPGAQWFAISLMVFGFTAFLLMIGSLIGPYVEERILKVIGMIGGRRTERLANHLIICGLSVEGRIVVDTLKARNELFVVVCGSEQKHDDLLAEGVTIVLGDPSSSETLEMVSVKKARALMALSDDDAINAFVTITARELNPALLIVAMVSSRENMQKLRAVGADKVISPTVIGAERLLNAALGEEDIICKA